MAIQVKPITLWRREVENRPGALAETVSPLAGVGANLQILMGYRHADGSRAIIELSPVTGKKATAAAQAAGLSPSGIPTLRVEGDDRAGVVHAIAQSMAGAGINIAFLIAQAVGRKFSAVVGFESDADAKTAAGLIKKLKATSKKK